MVVGQWPVWSGYVAAGWSLLYAVLGLYWTVGADGFPFAPVDEARPTGSILEGAGRLSAAFVAFGWLLAASLTLVIPDYALLALVAFAPVLLVFVFSGVPGEQKGIGDILYWH
ncbi:hypothetical protein ACIA5C_48515 [Actinoplanes sp. NPDC051343]|uniref:hypothetical protein n=1 Tax=Actinoplanes sp. NPDC051343 TaxID=3363906 RepID=UPI0037935282